MDYKQDLYNSMNPYQDINKEINNSKMNDNNSNFIMLVLDRYNFHLFYLDYNIGS